MAEILAPIDHFIDDKNCSDIVILADKTICQIIVIESFGLGESPAVLFFA
jgi:hypothetical protein